MFKERIIKCNRLRASLARSHRRSYGYSDICSNSANEDERNEAEDSCGLEQY